MIDETLIVLKAIGGHPISTLERESLSSMSLVQLAIGGQIKLTQAECDRIPPEQLCTLAIGGHVTLTRRDRNRIPTSLLVTLLIGRNATLDPGEIDRFDQFERQSIEMSLRR